MNHAGESVSAFELLRTEAVLEKSPDERDARGSTGQEDDIDFTGWNAGFADNFIYATGDPRKVVGIDRFELFFGYPFDD